MCKAAIQEISDIREEKIAIHDLVKRQDSSATEFAEVKIDKTTSELTYGTCPHFHPEPTSSEQSTHDKQQSAQVSTSSESSDAPDPTSMFPGMGGNGAHY